MNMASAGCRVFTALGLCIFYVGIVDCELSPLSTYVTPVGVEIRKTSDVRNLTVRYQASSKPFVKWSVDYDLFSGPDSDIELFNYFSETTHSGAAVILMPLDHFDPDPPSDVRVYMYVDDAYFLLQFKSEDDIMNRNNYIYDMNPIYYDTGPETELEYVKGEQLHIDLSLRSVGLGEYEVLRSAGRIDSVDYGLHPPEINQFWSLTPQRMANLLEWDDQLKPFLCADEFEEVNATSLTRQCTVNTSVENLSGKVTFELELKPRQENPIVKQIDFSRHVYMKEVSQDAPYRENTLLVLRVPNFARDPPDETITNSNPDFTYTAIGYPKPQIYLKRGCGTQAEPINSTEVPTSVMRYQTTMRFTFLNNIQRELMETYIITARSGNFEISDFLTIKKNTY